MTGNIMIIDDSPIDRKIICQILENRLHNINLFEAEDGLNIKEKLIKNNIHLCILDIIMPFRNGFQILKDMKEDSDLLDIPVIVCTGSNDEQAIERALTIGAYDYFSKPLSEEVMKIALPLKVRNAMEVMKRKEEIIYLSYHDKLTGIYNRRFYEEEIIRLNTERNLPISIVMGDMNGLKLTNDSYGHEVGDKLLKKIADILRSEGRNGDIVARTGGDEFVMLLPKTEIEEAEKIADRIRDKCRKEKDDPIKPSISIGISTKTHFDQSISTVYKSAEERMYSIKLVESKRIRSSIISSLRKNLYEHTYETENKIRQEELICSCKQLTALNEFKDRLLKNVTHDIRNPIATMVSMMEVLEEDYYYSESREIVHEVRKQVENTFFMVENLLQGMDNKKNKLVYEDITKFSQEAVIELQTSTEPKAIRIINDIEDTVTILVDKEILNIVLHSLLKNALKFSHSGGLISIQTHPTEQKVIIGIRDTGIGIDSNKADTFFNKILDDGSSEVILAEKGILISKEIIQSHKAQIWQDSIIQKGSTYYFSLPSYQQSEQ